MRPAYTVEMTWDHQIKACHFATKANAEEAFAKAKERGWYNTLRLYKSGAYGNPCKLLKLWERDEDDLHVRFGYKIHGFDTTRNPARSANTPKWYRTEAEALKAAKSMASRNGNDESLVIYKAIKVVRKQAASVEVIDVD